MFSLAVALAEANLVVAEWKQYHDVQIPSSRVLLGVEVERFHADDQKNAPVPRRRTGSAGESTLRTTIGTCRTGWALGGGLGLGGLAAPINKSNSGLSLEIDLPTTGQKLVFSKVGGDPKLALAIRPYASVRWGLSLAWSAVWIVGIAMVLLALRQPAGISRLLDYGPAFAIVLYFVFCALPTPLNIIGFVLMLVGAVLMARKYATTGVAQ